MSHLSHEVCGVDFFLSYNDSNSLVVKLLEHMKIFFKNNQLTYFSSDSIQFSQNYLQAIQLQAIRSKTFLFFIDRFALECDLFLNYYIYAKEHSSLVHLPILIPIIFDIDLENNYENEKDKLIKYKLIQELTKECAFVIKMSEMKSFDHFIEILKETVYEIIPIKFKPNEKPEFRFIDNLRPMINQEEEFFKNMKNIEIELTKRFEISRYNFKKILPVERVFIALSVPYEDFEIHAKKMINSQCHLICIDCISINQINYFNLIWKSNYEEQNSIGSAYPPAYIIFYDLNTAQLAQIYYEFSIEKKWNLELIDSYIKSKSACNKSKSADIKTKLKRSKTEHKISAITKSNDEMFFICQFKKIFNNSETINKLQHSIIDSRFNELFDQCVSYKPKQQNTISIPIRINPLVVNVNTLTNKHYYYTCLYRPIQNYKQDEKVNLAEHSVNLKQSPLYYCAKNLNDYDLMTLLDSKSKNNWKLIDLKAYKDVNSITKFSVIFDSMQISKSNYEGTFKLFTGLTKNETLLKIDEMNQKGMWAKLVTSYSYLNNNGEHVYAIFFCQF